MQRYRNRKLNRLVPVTVLAASALVGSANATPASSNFVGTQISKGQFPPMDVKADKTGKWDLFLKTKDDSDVYVTRNEIGVGGFSGWHTHPGPSLITVASGEVTVYDADDPLCSPKVYRAGEGLIDIGGGDIHLIRNASSAPAVTVAVQFLPVGAARRTDADQPDNCPTF